MSVSSRLTRKLHQVLGEEAKELLELMQQADSLGGELREILVRMEARLTGIDVKIAGVEARLAGIDVKIAGVEARLTGTDLKIGGVEARLTGIEIKIAGVETLVEKRSADLIKWSFVFWVGAVAAIAMLAGVLQ